MLEILEKVQSDKDRHKLKNNISVKFEQYYEDPIDSLFKDLSKQEAKLL